MNPRNILAAFTLALVACSSPDFQTPKEIITTPPSDPDSPWTVDSGDLKLLVTPSPWNMTFHDGNGDPLLSEHSGTDIGPSGSLGFHIGNPPEGNGDVALLTPITAGQPSAPPVRRSNWFHATELLESRYEGDTWIGEVATNDPTRTLTVTIAPAENGVISVEAIPSTATGIQAFGIAFNADADEKFYGFGERGNAVQQRGNDLEHYVGEGPYQDEEYGGITAVVPKWGIRWRKDATYFPIPWLMSSKAYGVQLDQDSLSYHRLGTNDANAWSMEIEEPELKFRVFAAETPAKLVERYSATLGRQPHNYAPWFFGPWVQADSDNRLTELQQADVPISLAATYLHYLPCGSQQGREQSQLERTTKLNAQGLAVHTYFNPMICTDYQPAYGIAASASTLQKDRSGADYVFPYTTTSVFNVSEFDFTAERAVEVYGDLLQEALDHGYEGWMEDFGEYTPLDAVAADGTTGTKMHNKHAREYHCAAQAATYDPNKPLARFVRSGWTGSVACSPIIWGGDPTTDFAFDGLESSIYQALSLGTSGAGIWGSDIGGFFALGVRQVTDELLQRWISFGAFSVIMRSQKDGIEIPEKPQGRPHSWDAQHVQHWRKYAKLHTQLYPAIQAAAEQYYATGMPIMRHHILTHPNDENAISLDDQYMFTNDWLIAPVYQPSATDRSLYLPEGQWVNWWASSHYDETSGSFTLNDSAEVLVGEQNVTINAPITEIPALVAAGTIIPMLAADVDTLADHGNNPDIVYLRDRLNELTLLAFPSGSRSSPMFADESLEGVEGNQQWSLTINGNRERLYRLQANLDALAQPFDTCAASLDGQAITFEQRGNTVEVEFTTQSGTLVLQGNCG